jgi:adenylosuccinate lyase
MQPHIKDIEKITNHDVKAVEYFIKKKFDELGLEEYKEFIHFGLTSQDINNTAIPYSFKLAINEVYLPAFTELVELLKKYASRLGCNTYACTYSRATGIANTPGQRDKCIC